MEKIWIKSAVPEDFTKIEIGTWIEGVGMVTTHWEKAFIRRYGERLANRDRFRVGVTVKHDHCDGEGDISNAALQAYFKKREKDGMTLGSGWKKKSIGKSHTGRMIEHT